MKTNDRHFKHNNIGWEHYLFFAMALVMLLIIVLLIIMWYTGTPNIIDLVQP